MEQRQFKATIVINADNEENAKKKIIVLKNIADNVSENAFTNILFKKIQRDANFFKKLADNPLLKMI